MDLREDLVIIKVDPLADQVILHQDMDQDTAVEHLLVQGILDILPVEATVVLVSILPLRTTIHLVEDTNPDLLMEVMDHLADILQVQDQQVILQVPEVILLVPEVILQVQEVIHQQDQEVILHQGKVVHQHLNHHLDQDQCSQEHLLLDLTQHLLHHLLTLLHHLPPLPAQVLLLQLLVLKPTHWLHLTNHHQLPLLSPDLQEHLHHTPDLVTHLLLTILLLTLLTQAVQVVHLLHTTILPLLSTATLAILHTLLLDHMVIHQDLEDLHHQDPMDHLLHLDPEAMDPHLAIILLRVDIKEDLHHHKEVILHMDPDLTWDLPQEDIR